MGAPFPSRLWVEGYVSLEHFWHVNHGEAYLNALCLARGVRVTEHIASASDRAASAYPSQGLALRSNAGALRSVYFFGSKPRRTSFHRIGIETGAPSRARGDNTATAVESRSLRK